MFLRARKILKVKKEIMKNVTKVNFYEKVVGQKHFMIKQTEERKM